MSHVSLLRRTSRARSFLGNQYTFKSVLTQMSWITVRREISWIGIENNGKLSYNLLCSRVYKKRNV